MIKYSIIMPVYNSEKTISRSIESILRQTISDWELVCVNDGSTDSSEHIIDSYRQKDNRIRKINQINQGPGVARNNGISKASGEYIAFLDSDDTWENAFLQKIDSELKNDKTDIVFYDINYCDCNGSIIQTVKQSRYRRLDVDALIEAQMCGSFLWGMVKVINRSLIINNGIHFGTENVGEESIFSFDVLRLAKNYSFVSEAIYNYFESENSQHTKGEMDPWWEVVNKMKIHLQDLKLLDKYSNGLKSLAMKACCISCYRICINHSYHIAKSNMKNAIKKYEGIYAMDEVCIKHTDVSTNILSFLIKHKLYLTVWLLSKIRNKSDQ